MHIKTALFSNKKSNRLKNQPLNSYVSIYSDEFSDADELAGDRTVISSGSDNIANPEAIMIDRKMPLICRIRCLISLVKWKGKF